MIVTNIDSATLFDNRDDGCGPFAWLTVFSVISLTRRSNSVTIFYEGRRIQALFHEMFASSWGQRLYPFYFTKTLLAGRNVFLEYVVISRYHWWLNGNSLSIWEETCWSQLQPLSVNLLSWLPQIYRASKNCMKKMRSLCWFSPCVPVILSLFLVVWKMFETWTNNTTFYFYYPDFFFVVIVKCIFLVTDR